MTIRSAVFLASALAFAPPTTVAVEAQSADVDLFYRGVADHFDLPTEEVIILSEWQITPEEVPVVLFLARRAGVSPDALVALRRGTVGWWALAERYGLDARVFHVPLPESASTGPLSGAYDAYRGTPSSDWAEIELADGDVIALANLRFVSEYLGIPPATALASADRAGSWVVAYGQLARQR